MVKETWFGSRRWLVPGSRMALTLAVAVAAFVLVPSARAAMNVVPIRGLRRAAARVRP